MSARARERGMERRSERERESAHRLVQRVLGEVKSLTRRRAVALSLSVRPYFVLHLRQLARRARRLRLQRARERERATAPSCSAHGSAETLRETVSDRGRQRAHQRLRTSRIVTAVPRQVAAVALKMCVQGLRAAADPSARLAGRRGLQEPQHTDEEEARHP